MIPLILAILCILLGISITLQSALLTHFPVKQFIAWFVLLCILESINMINKCPMTMAYLNTIEPISLQLFRTIGFGFFGIIKQALLLSTTLICLLFAPQKSLLTTYIQSRKYGLYMGGLLTLIILFISLVVPSTNADWPSLAGLDTYFPTVYIAIAYFVSYLFLVIFLLSIAYLFEYLFYDTHTKIAGYLVTSISGLCLVSKLSPGSLTEFLIMGIALSIVCTLMYRFIILYDKSTVAWFAFVLFVTEMSGRQIRTTYGDIAFALIIIMLWAVSYYISRHIQQSNQRYITSQK